MLSVFLHRLFHRPKKLAGASSRLRSFQFGNRGLSLIAVIVGVSIGFGVVLGVQQLIQTSFRGVKKAELLGQQVDLRNHLLSKIDCAKTKALSPCSSDMNVYDRNSVLVITAGTPKVFGDYKAKAVCESNQLVIKIQSTSPGASGDWISLFRSTGLGCAIP